jgi:hypothetical protein
MTHDELLQVIDFNAVEGSFDITVNSDRFNMLANNSRALRAVVELHKPEHSIRGYRCTFDDELFPCLNIQAIEKELG